MRFYYFAVIITGIMLLINLAGFISPSGSILKSFNLIDSQGNATIEDFKSSDLYSNSSSTDSTPGLTYILTGALGAAIVLGAFGRAPDIRYITAALVFALTGVLTADLIWLYTLITSYDVRWLSQVGFLLIGSLLVGLYITALQFWQGSD